MQQQEQPAVQFRPCIDIHKVLCFSDSLHGMIDGWTDALIGLMLDNTGPGEADRRVYFTGQQC